MALGVEKSNCLKTDELSPHVWSAPSVPSQRTQAPEDPALQIMYCKEQVYQEDGEFSLEELRAQRFYRALSDKMCHLNRLKQDLQLQIEQKQKQQLQQRNTSAALQEVVREQDDSVLTSAASCESAPFVTHSDQGEGRVDSRFSRGSVSREDNVNQSGSDVKPQKTVTTKPFAIFDENMQTNKISSSMNSKSLKLPSLSLKGPKPRADPSADKEVSISRSEEPILNGHCNKSVCRSPDDTREFARAAQLASTPFTGPDRTKTDRHSPELPQCTAVANTEPTPEEKKLSPILEISQEWGGTSFATFSHDARRRSCVERDVRSRLMDRVDVTSFPNFHQKAGLLPDTSADLDLDGEPLLYCSRMKDFSLFSSRNSLVVLKSDSSRVSWDFFISSRLASRRSHDDPDADVPVSCHSYENGCLTLWTLPPGDTLQDRLCECVSALDASVLVLRLLELLLRFHSCQLILGRLEPETLFVHRSGVTALDFSDCVDLELQTDVTTAQALPSAQRDIEDGRLSPTASPYQVDLLAAARLSHQLLFSRDLSVTQDESGWRLQEDSGAPVELFWRDLFHVLLNPEKPSVQVLSDLIQTVRSSLRNP